MSEELNDAKWKMILASHDYDDNSGASNAQEFWHDFEIARDAYKKLLKADDGSA